MSRNIAVVAFFDGFSKVAALGVSVLLIRSLPENEYALFTFFFSSAMLVRGVLGLSPTVAYVASESYRFSAPSSSDVQLGNPSAKDGPDMFSAVVVLILVFHLVAALLIFPFSNYLRDWFHPIKVGDGIGMVLALVFAWSLLGTCSELVFARFQAHNRYSSSGAYKVVSKFTLLIALVLALFMDSLSFLAVGICFIGVDLLVFGTALFREKISWRKAVDVSSLSRLAPIVRESLWLMVFYSSLQILTNTDVLVIASFMTSGDVAQYGVSLQYYYILIALLPAIKTVLGVRMFRADMADNRDLQVRFMKKWLRSSAWFGCLLMLGAIVLAPFVMRINGPGYGEAVAPFRILCVGVALAYIFSPVQNILRAQKRFGLMATLGGSALILNLAGNLAMIKLGFGIRGIAVMTVSSHGFLNVISTVLVLKVGCLNQKASVAGG